MTKPVLEMPDTQLLKALGRQDLVHAIRKKHGGFYAVAQKMTLPIKSNATAAFEIHKKLASRDKRRTQRVIHLKQHHIF
jgi:hypothetical protein